MELKEKKPFNKRAFVSVAMFAAALGLPISGLMNHQMQFEPFSQTRHFWMSVHNVSAILFCLFAIMHITLNWTPLMHYIKKIKGVSISKEALLAVALVFVVVAFISSHALHTHAG